MKVRVSLKSGRQGQSVTDSTSTQTSHVSSHNKEQQEQRVNTTIQVHTPIQTSTRQLPSYYFSLPENSKLEWYWNYRYKNTFMNEEGLVLAE